MNIPNIEDRSVVEKLLIGQQRRDFESMLAVHDTPEKAIAHALFIAAGRFRPSDNKIDVDGITVLTGALKRRLDELSQSQP